MTEQTQDVRGILATAIDDYAQEWGYGECEGMESAILAALAAAGMSVVAADRLERLQQECREIADGIAPEGFMHLMPGDLDPIVPAAGEEGGA
jgi:hypothetical protein